MGMHEMFQFGVMVIVSYSVGDIDYVCSLCFAKAVNVNF